MFRRADLLDTKLFNFPVIFNSSNKIHQTTHTRPLAVSRIRGAIGMKKAMPLFPVNAHSSIGITENITDAGMRYLSIYPP